MPRVAAPAASNQSRCEAIAKRAEGPFRRRFPAPRRTVADRRIRNDSSCPLSRVLCPWSRRYSKGCVRARVSRDPAGSGTSGGSPEPAGSCETFRRRRWQSGRLATTWTERPMTSD